MKKLIQIISLLTMSYGFAQNSIQVTNTESSQTVAPNDAFFITTTPTGHFTKTFDLKNTSASTQTYTVYRYDPVLNAGADAYFCFGGTCYGPSTIISANSLVLTSGQSASQISGQYQMLTAYLDEAATIGLSHIKYSFKNVNVPTDTFQVNLRYNDPTTGINELGASLEAMSIYPNPIVNEVTLRFNADKTGSSSVSVLNTLGKIVISKDILVNAGLNVVKIDAEQLAAGNYFITYGSGKEMVTKKIVVAK